MATLMETGVYRGVNSLKFGNDPGSLHPVIGDEVQPDTRNLSSMICPLLGVLALGAVAIVAVSGQFPWFVAPLALFGFFGFCFLRG